MRSGGPNAGSGAAFGGKSCCGGVSAWQAAALRWAWLTLMAIGVAGWLWTGRYEFDRQGGVIFRMDNWTGETVACRRVRGQRGYVCGEP